MENDRLSEALKEAYATAPDNDVLLETLEFSYSYDSAGVSRSESFRVVRDYKEFTGKIEPTAIHDAGQRVIFNACAFDIQLPEVSEGASKELTVTVDNVTQELGKSLDKAVALDSEILIIYRPYLLSNTETPQLNPPYVFVLRKVTINEKSVVATASFSIEFTNRAFPNDYYTLERFPGLGV